MPAYPLIKIPGYTPNPILLTTGVPVHLIGSRNDDTAPTIMQVTSVAQALTTITLGVQVLAGNIPAVGSTIGVIGTAVDAGNANVPGGAVLTAVTINATTGVGTVTYTVVPSTTFATTADGGQAVVAVAENPETISAVYASIPAAPQFNDPGVQNMRTFTARLTLGTGFTAFSANLQYANEDVDSAYANINATVDFATATAGTYAMEYTQQAARFYRIHISAVTGSGSVSATLMV